jgi:hypothetical protein
MSALWRDDNARESNILYCRMFGCGVRVLLMLGLGSVVWRSDGDYIKRSGPVVWISWCGFPC